MLNYTHWINTVYILHVCTCTCMCMCVAVIYLFIRSWFQLLYINYTGIMLNGNWYWNAKVHVFISAQLLNLTKVCTQSLSIISAINIECTCVHMTLHV